MNWHRLTIMRILYGSNPMRGCEIRDASNGRVPNGSLYVELTRRMTAGYVGHDGQRYRMLGNGRRAFDRFLRENALQIATK